MPYSGPNDKSLPANVLKMSAVRQRQWIHVFDSEKAKGVADGEAMHRANGVLMQQMGRSMAAGKSDLELASDLASLVIEASAADIEAGLHCGDGYWSGSVAVLNPDKLSQDEANYDPFGASGGQGCATCRWFMWPNSCYMVDGMISPSGLSNEYKSLEPSVPDVPSVQIVDSNGDTIDFEDLLSGLTAGGMSLEAGWHATWTTAYQNNLPDSSFAWIDPGGKKDGTGRTVPRSLRHFPYKDEKGALDEAHVRDALGRVPQAHVSSVAKHAALVKLHAAARTLGIKLAPASTGASAGMGSSSMEAVGRVARSAAQNIMDFLGLGAPVSGEVLVANRLWLTGHDDPGSVLPTPEGRLRYWTVASNNFFDNKGKEFPEAAQREYVDWVWSDPSQRMPELQVWHTPDTRLGQADWIDFDGHFRHSTGLIDVGREEIAQSLANDPENAMSWGYFVIWDEHDRAERVRGYEESVLPRKYAGNSFTSFGLQEDSMAFTEPRKAYLKEVLQLSDTDVAAREQRWEQFGQVVERLGVSFHELEEYVDSERGAPPAAAVDPVVGSAAVVAAAAGTPPADAGSPAVAGAQDAGLATQAMTPESLAGMLGSLLTAQLQPLQQQLAGIHANQQAFEQRVTAVLPAVKTIAPGGFDATRAPSTTPGIAQDANGQPVVAQHSASGALQPLDPQVLAAIQAGARDAGASGAGGATPVDWLFNRLAGQHPLLNGQPTEIRG